MKYFHVISSQYKKTWTFILYLHATDICKSEKGETLVCRYDPEFASLERVWCKKDSEECCTGFAFGKKIQSLDNGSVEITNDTPAAFTVTVQNLTQGSGVYWCGLMFQNQTIIKLAEKSFSTGENLVSGLYYMLFLDTGTAIQVLVSSY